MPNEIDLLQGVWTVSELEVDGQNDALRDLSEAQVTIKKNRFTSTGMGAVYEGTIELDSSEMPPHLTMHFDAGPEKGNKNLGIYEVRNGILRICLATRGTERPARFATKPGYRVCPRNTDEIQRTKRTATGSQHVLLSAPVSDLKGSGGWFPECRADVPMEESTVKWVKRRTSGMRPRFMPAPRQ